MERDWKIIQIVVVLLILADGINNIYKVTSNNLVVIGPSLNSFFYLPSITLSVFLVFSIILFFTTKKIVFYKLLSWTILLYGIYSIVFTLLTLSPLFRDYWYIMALGVLLGIFEFTVGKKMIEI
ncbi:hypothetical protein NSS79_29080 [Paenibacillus sp. FSL L8-0436]|uniref:hypothetical protein n=1 Tax=Paenibacillus sp. FSL L8-0436 TaxID=2954686 RepID=UPI003158E041